MSIFHSFVGCYIVLSCLSFLALAISFIAFSRLSMARIEKEIEQDGLPRPAVWDGLGVRAWLYAWVILAPVGFWNPLNNPLIDVKNIRNRAQGIDRKWGIALHVSSFIFFVVGLFGTSVLKPH